MKRLLFYTLSAIVVMNAATAEAAVMVPVPAILDGIPVAQEYDDFLSYSAVLIEAIQEQAPAYAPESIYGNWKEFNKAGTGTLDVVIANGPATTNTNVLGESFNMETAVALPGGVSLATSGPHVWGTTPVDGTLGNADVSVAKILRILDYYDPLFEEPDIPVFVFDNNQTGTDPSMGATAQVRVFNESGVLQASWSFDATKDGVFDDDDYVHVVPTINAGPPDTLSGQTYSVDHNLGSGTNEFVVFAPTMDFNQFRAHPDWRVEVELNMADINDGFEELYLTGLVGFAQVPEPASMAIWSIIGMAGLGLGWVRSRGKR
jgi:hypothetical protein